MEIRQLIVQVMNKSVTEYFSEEPVGFSPIPRLYPPASAKQILTLERRAGQFLEPHYRKFLSLTDGMDGLSTNMLLFGCHDWDEGGRAAHGLTFLEGLRDDGTAEDVGLPGDIELLPVSVDDDRARAIFMLYRPDILPERFWWVGEGSSSFFGTFADLLGHALDPRSYSPREEID
jgi:hypothetical protein